MLEALQHLLDRLTPLKRTDVPGVLVVSDSHEIRDIEDDLAAPRRKRGKRVFETVDGFAAYVLRHKGEGTALFGNAESSRIIAVLNDHAEGQPGHGDHGATLALPLHRDLEAWITPTMPLSQGKLIDLFDEQMHSIAEPSAADLITMIETLRFNKNTAVESVRDARRGGFRVTLTDQESGSTESADIPDRIKIAAPIFKTSTERRVITARLTWRLVDKNVFFTVKFLDLEQHVEDELRAIAKSVTEKTGHDVWW